MYRIFASYRAVGPSRNRPFHMPARVESPREHRVWCIDTIHTRVAAVDVDGALWLAGDAVYVSTDGGAWEPVPSTEVTPPGHDSAGPKRWARIDAQVGARVVAIAGAARAPEPGIADRDALLDAVLTLPVVPELRWFRRLLGTHNPELEAAALILDVVAAPVFADLPAWIADVLERGIDMSWFGNEGDGFVQAIRRPFTQSSVVEGLLTHAREDPELTRITREYTEIWIEDSGEPGPVANRVVPDDPTHGWFEPLDVDASAEHVVGTTGAWLDPSTRKARRAWTLELPGAAIVGALREHVEQPAIVAIYAFPTVPPSESASAVHLFGGIDRASGDLVGFALHRLWT